MTVGSSGCFRLAPPSERRPARKTSDTGSTTTFTSMPRTVGTGCYTTLTVSRAVDTHRSADAPFVGAMARDTTMNVTVEFLPDVA